MTTPPPIPDVTVSTDEAVAFPGLKRGLFFYLFKPWVKLGHPILLFEHLQQTFGNVAQYRFLGTPIVYLNDPEYIREVLINQASAFVKERTVKRMKVLLGEGLITSDDPIHIRSRRIAAPAFHRQRIAAYGDQIVAIAASQRDRWHEGQVLDIGAASMELSLEIVARTLFDTEVTTEIRSINDEVNTIMGLYNFIVAFPQLEKFVNFPIPGVIKFRRSKARLDAVVGRLIREHREASLRGEEDKGDLLSMLLSSRDEEGDHSGLSDEQVRDEVLTIFLAGYETVANALTWTWYLLSQNPEVEARLHAELDEVLGGRLPVLADYAALKYTEMVFAESMRLYPPAWAMGRMATRPVRVGPYEIPEGAHVFFSQYMMHRDPRWYPEPLKFDPERFSAENKAGRPKFAYFPFGGGGRQCIGEGFAWMEGVFSIATVAQRWRFEFLGTREPEVQAKITLRPEGAVRMRVVGR
ncbi:cytochrome P450 [Terriglobus saanensis]|uniref:Cytochrome P450 n=1 Tax=Terriglobus saanensis (strain ATCC BAA-1853 / DSM 23119 / SP1PR4) TaxID=401053 RepID=E8V5J8_TERSS|nr:cytochrome P450 [Terriglobus saanensis]ADV81532.1 cytochrome P450 [Terriglobus saanensis SP1PR4]